MASHFCFQKAGSQFAALRQVVHGLGVCGKIAAPTRANKLHTAYIGKEQRGKRSTALPGRLPKRYSSFQAVH